MKEEISKKYLKKNWFIRGNYFVIICHAWNFAVIAYAAVYKVAMLNPYPNVQVRFSWNLTEAESENNATKSTLSTSYSAIFVWETKEKVEPFLISSYGLSFQSLNRFKFSKVGEWTTKYFFKGKMKQKKSSYEISSQIK